MTYTHAIARGGQVFPCRVVENGAGRLVLAVRSAPLGARAAAQLAARPHVARPIQGELLGNPVKKASAVHGRRLASRSALSQLQKLGTEELKRVARLGVEGVAKSIERGSRREHRESSAYQRHVVGEIKGAGGIRRPEGMTGEEWRNRLPRALHHQRRRGAGVPLDELAQGLADRRITKDAYSDTALDYLARLYEEASRPAPKAAPAQIRRAARAVVDRKAAAAARELIQTAARQTELRLKKNPVRGRRASAERIARNFHGDVRRVVRLPMPVLPKKAYEIGKVEAVIYRPPTWSRITPVPRIHHFEAPRPRLLGFSSRPPWMIYGGGARFTSRGFIG